MALDSDVVHIFEKASVRLHGLLRIYIEYSQHSALDEFPPAAPR
jgi:hypothetical protein